MSLFKQILLLVTALLMMTLIIVLKINFDSAREFTANQSYLDAKNQANILALSLSSNPGDEAYVQTSINAMFDGGYFESITFVDPMGNILYEKKEEIMVHGVPEFVINLVDLTIPEAEARVMNGWTIAGILKIKGSPGSSYKKLWDTLKQLCFLFAVLACIILFVSALGLRTLLRALDEIRHQAERISNNEFIMIEKIPSTPELKLVVKAMNTMAIKVKKIFDRDLKNLARYQELKYSDKITGLHNRNSFIKHLKNHTEKGDKTSGGQIIILGLKGMAEIEQTGDRSFAHQIFKHLADSMEDRIKKIENGLCARFPRREFAAILPGCNENESMQIADHIIRNFQNKLMDSAIKAIGIHGGVSSYCTGDDIGMILSKADYALSRAKSEMNGTIKIFKEEQSQTALGKMEWKTMIESAFLEDRFHLTTQPVVSKDGEFHREIFVNMLDVQGIQYQAGLFMPMVKSLGFAGRLDRFVLMAADKYLSRNPKPVLSVNITTDFCLDRLAAPWLREFLSKRKQFKDRLFFEIHENTLVQYPEVCIDLAGLISGMGFKFGIDHCALQKDTLKLLEKIKPSYIKIERDYLEAFDDPEKVDMVLNALFTISDSLNIDLIATKIENETQHLALAGKNITFFQGHGIAGVTPLETEHE